MGNITRIPFASDFYGNLVISALQQTSYLAAHILTRTTSLDSGISRYYYETLCIIGSLTY